MRTRAMRRRALPLALALLAAGCSKSVPEDAGRPAPAVEADRSGPSIGAAHIPGVALTYSYDFLLPIDRVAAVQEQHASQCEALGPQRCRVTGMTYRTGNRTIAASLDVKLAPELARRFGKQGVGTVTAQGGMLTQAEITSQEAGAAIAALESDTAAIDGELANLTAQLARPGLGKVERAQLQTRIQTIRDTRRGAQTTKAEAMLKLASTPMHISYASGDVDPGFSDGRFIGAFKDGWSNVVAGSALLLTLAITLLPWALLVALAFGLWRVLVRWLGPKPSAP
jgi:hypothetical protein